MDWGIDYGGFLDFKWLPEKFLHKDMNALIVSTSSTLHAEDRPSIFHNMPMADIPDYRYEYFNDDFH